MVNRVVMSLLVLTIGAQMLILYRGQNSASALALPTLNPIEAIAERALTVSVQDTPRLGDGDARIAIVEFGDFECPFCRRHANSVLPPLKKKFIDTGIAAYYYLHLPLKAHSHAIDAASAAECARGQGRFWEMHDLLFAEAEPASLTTDALRRLASSLRIDTAAFDACMGKATERIHQDGAQAGRLGIEGTPVFVLGTMADRATIRLSTRINGAQPLDVFAKAIDELERGAIAEAAR